MKSLLVLLLLTLTLSATAPCQDKGEKAATDSANQWLARVDSGDFAGSWEWAAPMFKSGISKDQWVVMMEKKHALLGKVLSRTLKSAVYTTSLPGAPAGQYVVIVYESSFVDMKSAIETVTPSLGMDGQWRVSGYFIR